MTGFGMGEKFWGGHSELASVDASFLLDIPNGFTMKKCYAMRYSWIDGEYGSYLN